MEEIKRADILICDCSHPEHQILIRHDHTYNESEVTVEVHMCHLSFWERIRLAIKYVFGYKSPYGHFCDIILTKNHIPQLKKLIETLELDYRDESDTV